MSTPLERAIFRARGVPLDLERVHTPRPWHRWQAHARMQRARPVHAHGLTARSAARRARRALVARLFTDPHNADTP